MSDARCALPAAAQLGECPVWSTAERLLYWIDIDGRRVHRFDPATGEDEHRGMGGQPGSLALTGDPGRLLVAVEHQLVWLDFSSGETTPWIDLEAPGTGNRLNDGRTDRVGRFWVGSMYADTSEARFTGSLHRVERSGVSVASREGVGVANGLAFSPDGTVMYFADTLHDTVWAYDYDAATGQAHRERVFIEFTGLPGRPDGACVDEDGCYWVACVFGWAVLRITPTGRVDRRIDLPIEKPTMPAFGGPDLATLFITSIGAGGSHAAAPDQPLAGGLFVVEDLGVRGLPEPPFAGRPQS